MFNNILHNHVTISMKNGAVLEGFLQSVDEKYMKLIETDNSSVIIQNDSISFVRIGYSDNEVENIEESQLKEDCNRGQWKSDQSQHNDLSMNTPTGADLNESYKPQFKRQT